jgi:hypothetical protein
MVRLHLSRLFLPLLYRQTPPLSLPLAARERPTDRQNTLDVREGDKKRMMALLREMNRNRKCTGTERTTAWQCGRTIWLHSLRKYYNTYRTKISLDNITKYKSNYNEFQIKYLVQILRRNQRRQNLCVYPWLYMTDGLTKSTRDDTEVNRDCIDS